MRCGSHLLPGKLTILPIETTNTKYRTHNTANLPRLAPHRHWSLTSLAWSNTMSLTSATMYRTAGGAVSEFRCPEEFGYYQHPEDCSLYYVCVFGGPLLESCTGQASLHILGVESFPFDSKACEM